jgi:zinc protease
MTLSVSASASFQQTVLDNGLRVILREVRERPLVGVWMWYHVGGRNELPGTTGVSHWVEHMLFKSQSCTTCLHSRQ